MNPYTFARTIARAVAQDSAFQTWAAANFNKACKVYLGLPSVDFPKMDEDAPFVVFGDPGKSAAQTRRERSYSLDAWMAITIDDFEVVAENNYVEPAGVALINEGIVFLIAAVATALPAGIEISSADSMTDTLGAHDEVNGYLALDFVEKLTIGTNPMD